MDIRNRIKAIPIWPALAVLGAILIAAPLGTFARWAAAAVLFLALPPCWKACATPLVLRIDRLAPDWRRLAATCLPYAAATVGTLVALGPVALGQMPVSQDHANHYFATHVLVHEMLPTGRFFGWTDSLGTGYPFGDTYHTAPYLVTGLVHLASFGLVPLQNSYAFGIALAWLVPVLAVTAWARRLAGPWAAAFAGLAYGLDMGGDREGGWIYGMFHGVWPQQLGTGVWLFALLALWRLVEKPDTRRLSAAALLAGLCLWLHPLNAMTLLAAALLLVAISLPGALSSETPDARRGVLALIPALLAAGLIGVLWVVRMVLASDVVFANTAYWEPLGELVKRLLEGHLFENELALICGLALVGAFAAARAGGRLGAFTVTLTAALVLLGSMVFVLESDLGLLGGELGVMQYRRFSIAAKPLWFALAGAGLSAVGRGLAVDAARRAVSSVWIRLLLAALLAPFAVDGLGALPRLIRSPVARPLTAERTRDDKNLKAIARTLAREAERCRGSFCRAVYWEKHGHGGLYPVISLADAGFAWEPTLTLPANNFKWINETADVKTMARLGVSVVVSKWDVADPGLEEIAKYGRHRILRVKDWAWKPVEVLGGGAAEIVSWSPERRVIRLSGTSPGTTRVVLQQPPYGKWHARQGGATRGIAPRHEGRLLLSEVRGARDGELVLEYDDTPLENAATAVGGLLIAACLLGIALRPRPMPLPFGPRAETLVLGGLGIGLGAVALAAAVGLVAGGRAAAEREWAAGSSEGTRLLAVLHHAAPARFAVSPEHACVPAYVRNPEFGCAEADLAPRLVAAARRGDEIPSCLRVGVPANGRTELAFDLPGGTAEIAGRLHQLSDAPVSVTLSIDGREDSLGGASRGGARFRHALSGPSERATFVLRAKETAYVCLEAAALGR